MNYDIPQAAKEFFEANAQQPVDLISHIIMGNVGAVYTINCPYCAVTKSVPMLGTLQTDDLNFGFELECECGYTPSVDALYRDLMQARTSEKMCLRGTHGNKLLAESLAPLAESISDAELVPRVKRKEFESAIQSAAARSNIPKWAVGRLLELYMPSSPVTKAAASHYASVLRAFRFVDKAHTQCWIRSPALCCHVSGVSTPEMFGTLPRAQKKYRGFIKLVAQKDGSPVVPTSDADLFWHTHQLSPEPYRQYCNRTLGILMDHDDKERPGGRNDAFSKTNDLYVEKFGEEYDACLCWSCELERNDKEMGRKKCSPMSDSLEDWSRRVAVVFWKEVESRRKEGRKGLNRDGLEKVLRRGPQKVA